MEVMSSKLRSSGISNREHEVAQRIQIPIPEEEEKEVEEDQDKGTYVKKLLFRVIFP